MYPTAYPTGYPSVPEAEEGADEGLRPMVCTLATSTVATILRRTTRAPLLGSEARLVKQRRGFGGSVPVIEACLRGAVLLLATEAPRAVEGSWAPRVPTTALRTKTRSAEQYLGRRCPSIYFHFVVREL